MHGRGAMKTGRKENERNCKDQHLRGTNTNSCIDRVNCCKTYLKLLSRNFCIYEIIVIKDWGEET